MESHINVNKKVLITIDEQDCDNSLKEFLRRIFFYELKRKRGEEYVKLYEREIEKYIEMYRGEEDVD